jgi:bifunctional oligoribonuclease and PAP phosphatase NrnA
VAELETQYARVAEALKGAGSIHVCAHVDPDGDAVGSMLGLTLALRSLGKNATPIIADGRLAPETYRFLPGFDLLKPADGQYPADVAVALDTPTPERLGDAQGLALAAGALLVLDHHPDNRLFGAVNVHDAAAASTGQLVFRLLPYLGAVLDADIATCLYAALVTDTGRFQYSNTDASTLREAADLLEAGARSREVSQHVYEEFSPGLLKLVGSTLSRLAVVNSGHVAYSWIGPDDFADTKVPLSGTETLIDTVRSTGGVDVVFLVKCDGTNCKVSLRAKSSLDVGAIARLFGGGGHAAAAGFSFEGTKDALLPKLLPELPGAES